MSIAMVTSIVPVDHPADAGVQPTWPCATDRFLFQHPGNVDTTVYAVDIGTGETTEVFTIAGRTIDAAAYNPVDGYFYGFDDTVREIVRIGSDGSVVGLGLPGGWPDDTPESRTGEFDADIRSADEPLLGTAALRRRPDPDEPDASGDPDIGVRPGDRTRRP